MKRIIEKIKSHIIAKKQLKLMKTLDKMKKLASSAETITTSADGLTTFSLTDKEQSQITKLQEEVKTIILQQAKTPEALLNFAKEHNCNIYRFKQAKKILNLLKEEEGFLPPFSGTKAFWLTLIVGIFCEKKLIFSWKTQPMFIYPSTKINKHHLFHQFYKWYNFKSNISGFDEKSQKLFKKHIQCTNDRLIKNLKPNEIIALKNAIARDNEATDFVMKLSKELDGAKNVINKILNEGSAQI